MGRKYKQGIYIPPESAKDKWIITEAFDMKEPGIKYRSSWEHKFCVFCSHNPYIVKANSEGTIVPYISPVDGKKHRYYIDYTIQMEDGRIFLVEVKPSTECNPPKKPKKDTPKSNLNYQKSLQTYVINQAKWEAAKLFAISMGATFIIITEKELGI